MNHRGVEFTVAETALPGVWQWQFRIGDETRTGKTETKIDVGDPARPAAHRSGAEGDRAQDRMNKPPEPGSATTRAREVTSVAARN